MCGDGYSDVIIGAYQYQLLEYLAGWQRGGCGAGRLRPGANGDHQHRMDDGWRSKALI
jgi:hypothetical protein